MEIADGLGRLASRRRPIVISRTGAGALVLWWPIAHEMGHVFGFGHSAEPRDAWPDNDRAATASASGARTFVN